jgi:hypothetical protein
MKISSYFQRLVTDERKQIIMEEFTKEELK